MEEQSCAIQATVPSRALFQISWRMQRWKPLQQNHVNIHWKTWVAVQSQVLQLWCTYWLISRSFLPDWPHPNQKSQQSESIHAPLLNHFQSITQLPVFLSPTISSFLLVLQSSAVFKILSARLSWSFKDLMQFLAMADTCLAWDHSNFFCLTCKRWWKRVGGTLSICFREFTGCSFATHDIVFSILFEHLEAQVL